MTFSHFEWLAGKLLLHNFGNTVFSQHFLGFVDNSTLSIGVSPIFVKMILWNIQSCRRHRSQSKLKSLVEFYSLQKPNSCNFHIRQHGCVCWFKICIWKQELKFSGNQNIEFVWTVHMLPNEVLKSLLSTEVCMNVPRVNSENVLRR